MAKPPQTHPGHTFRMSDALPAKAPIGSLRTLWPFVRRHRNLFVAWLLALAPWVARIGRIYLSPRKDGKPG